MRKIVIFLFALIIIVLMICKSTNILIPDNAIRLRIIANSDSLSDQKDKAIIKNEINSILFYKLRGIDSYKVASNIIENSIGEIKDVVNRYYEKNEIIYGSNHFPEKEYKGVTYKEGNYESLVVKLGEGKGKNFWCVLFPPLCMIDENKLGNVTYSFFVSELLKNIK